MLAIRRNTSQKPTRYILAPLLLLVSGLLRCSSLWRIATAFARSRRRTGCAPLQFVRPFLRIMCACFWTAGPDVQQVLASTEAMISQGARQALAAAAVATSAELSAIRSTLQVLSSHLQALQASHTLPPSQGKRNSCNVGCLSLAALPLLMALARTSK